MSISARYFSEKRLLRNEADTGRRPMGQREGEMEEKERELTKKWKKTKT